MTDDSSPSSRAPKRDALQKPPPPLLQAYYDGEADLDRELAGRFPQMPLMSLLYMRTVSARRHYGVATATTQDGAAGVRFDLDPARGLLVTYTFASMLGYTFAPARLSAADRDHWLETVGRVDGEIAFLWGAARWEADYLIAVAHPHFTQLYAFSNRAEAAARLTADVTGKLLDWLGRAWG